MIVTKNSGYVLFEKGKLDIFIPETIPGTHWYQ